MKRLRVLRDAIVAALVLSLAAQIGYEVSAFGRQPLTFFFVFRIVLIAGFVLSLLVRARSPLPYAAVRLWIAVVFAYSIADRFGVLGHDGAPGVSWGSWTNFVAYVHVLNGLLPRAVAPVLAVAATAYEAVLVVTLALGIFSRLALLATALLTALYVVTMSFTSGFASQFEYAVLLICTGSLFLAVTFEGSPASAHTYRAVHR